jgi:hypothetical protein
MASQIKQLLTTELQARNSTVTDFHMLSPFPEHLLPWMWEKLEEFRSQMVDDLSPQTPLDLRNYFHNGQERYSYAFLDSEERPVGAVWAEQISGSSYMGHLVFNRDAAGKIFMTSRALHAMAAKGVTKLFWESYEDNTPYLMFLRKLGAKRDRFVESQPAKRDGAEVKTLLFSSDLKEFQ